MPLRGKRGGQLPFALCIAVCAFAPLRGASAAQEPAKETAQEPEQTYDEAAVRAQMDIVLREHERVRHGESTEPDTTGVEQGDNDMRSRTPALINAARTQAQLDPEDMHKRALAMYEDRAHFNSAGVTAPKSDAEGASAAHKARAKPQAEEPASARNRTAIRWLSGALIAVGGAIAWIFSKR